METDFFISICSETGKTYKDSWRKIADKLIYTGAIDEYFDYQLGRLDWRTVAFKTRVEDVPNYQGNAVVNYTSLDKPYTRIIEHKHFEMFGQHVYDCPFTVVSEEYSSFVRFSLLSSFLLNSVMFFVGFIVRSTPSHTV